MQFQFKNKATLTCAHLFCFIIVFTLPNHVVFCCFENIVRHECTESFSRKNLLADTYSYKPQIENKRHHHQSESAVKRLKADSWNLVEQSFQNCESFVIQPVDFNWTIDGYLRLNRTNTFYPPGTFCIREDGSAEICINPTTTMRIWKKCCADDEVLSSTSNECVKITEGESLYRPIVDGQNQLFNTGYNKPHLTALNCPGGKLQILSKNSCSWPRSSTKSFDRFHLGNHVQIHTEYNCSFQLSQQGIKYESTEGLFLRKVHWKNLSHEDYCLDGTYEKPICSIAAAGDKEHSKCKYNEYEVLLLCDTTSVSAEETSNRTKSLALAITWASTCPLLLIAAVANIIFVQRNVHGWTLTSYLISMFWVNIGSVILVLEERSEAGCRFIDFFMKFIYFSTLCWMTSINFGLWKTFRQSNLQRTSPRRFFFYFLFSTLSPAAVVTLSYFMGRKGICDDPAKQNLCALYNYSTIPYYSGPIVGMILLNLIMFLRTTFRILWLRKETNAVLNNTNKDHVESFRLFSKLFLMTGSIWVIRLFLLILQVNGLYFTWYGVALEIVFSTPEAIFSIMVLIHPEIIKWVVVSYPRLSRMLKRVIPCCKVRMTDLPTPLGSVNLPTTTPNQSL